MQSQEPTTPVGGEREPGWYWTKMWDRAPWQPARYHFEAEVLGPDPEGFWRAHAMQGVLLDNSFAEIGPRIVPPTGRVELGERSNTDEINNNSRSGTGEAG